MKGFTLVEILIGLTIIGMLFGAGFVSYRDFSRRQALASFGKEIQGDLRLAQTNASAGIKPTSAACQSPNILDDIAFEVTSANTYQLEADCIGVGINATIALKSVTLPAGLTIATPAINPIKFKILGQGNNIPAGTTQTIRISQGGTNATFTITVTSGGEIK